MRGAGFLHTRVQYVEPAVGQAVGDGRGQRICTTGHIQEGECRAAGDEAGQGIEHLKRILMEKCLPEKIKKKIWFRRPMVEVWKFLDNVIIKPDTFIHVDATYHHTRPIPEKKWKAMKEDLELLLFTFEHVRETHSTPISHSTLQVGDLTEASNCTTGIREMRMGKKLGDQVAQVVCHHRGVPQDQNPQWHHHLRQCHRAKSGIWG